ncbi:hypothetical protein ABIB95_002150 [Bradyrhizobium sp. LA2.1]
MCRSIYDSWRKRSRKADRCSGRCPRDPPAGRMLKGLEAGRATSLNMVGSHPYDQDPGHSDKRLSAHHWASRCGMSAMLRSHWWVGVASQTQGSLKSNRFFFASTPSLDRTDPTDQCCADRLFSACPRGEFWKTGLLIDAYRPTINTGHHSVDATRAERSVQKTGAPERCHGSTCPTRPQPTNACESAHRILVRRRDKLKDPSPKYLIDATRAYRQMYRPSSVSAAVRSATAAITFMRDPVLASGASRSKNSRVGSGGTNAFVITSANIGYTIITEETGISGWENRRRLRRDKR